MCCLIGPVYRVTHSSHAYKAVTVFCANSANVIPGCHWGTASFRQPSASAGATNGSNTSSALQVHSVCQSHHHTTTHSNVHSLVTQQARSVRSRSDQAGCGTSKVCGDNVSVGGKPKLGVPYSVPCLADSNYWQGTASTMKFCCALGITHVT